MIKANQTVWLVRHLNDKLQSGPPLLHLQDFFNNGTQGDLIQLGGFDNIYQTSHVSMVIWTSIVELKAVGISSLHLRHEH